ncbi:hypothetical protein C8046_01620 [Serinibacter arcticus]|uniref:Interferon-induced transmembrane protein n=1 Tax=Serinibacter arcticus TaxID=1655435 RepID=A0A2U1ZRM3_9MICO|nr:CD225/dispanin family protein [Serinibacter arcticus]PWD49600.1 hypothetical protein C8046_01620 [Serinibacter arcticus]
MSYLPPPRPGDEPEETPPSYGSPQYGQSGPTGNPGDSYGTPPSDPYGIPPSDSNPFGTPPPPPAAPYSPYSSAYASGPVGTPPANNLVWAILTTVLCCLPAGVVSIVFAAQVNSKWAMGDAAGAQRSAANARTWAIVSAVLGVIAGIVVFASQGASS